MRNAMAAPLMFCCMLCGVACGSTCLEESTGPAPLEEPSREVGSGQETLVPASPVVEPSSPASSSEEATPAAAAPGDGIEWQLRAEPTRLRMADRDGFRLFLRATNRGSAAARPNVHAGAFFVDDQPSMLLNLAFGNGVMEPGWMSLPPGESVETPRGVGDGLFTAPGDYTIRYTYGSSTSTVNVHVVR